MLARPLPGNAPGPPDRWESSLCARPVLSVARRAQSPRRGEGRFIQDTILMRTAPFRQLACHGEEVMEITVFRALFPSNRGEAGEAGGKELVRTGDDLAGGPRG